MSAKLNWIPKFCQNETDICCMSILLLPKPTRAQKNPSSLSMTVLEVTDGDSTKESKAAENLHQP